MRSFTALQLGLLVLCVAWSGLADLAAADKNAPKEGARFTIAPKMPKYAHAVFIFHDKSGELWPAFLHGRGDKESTVTIKGGKPTGTWSVASAELDQRRGRQDTRLFGEIAKAGDKGPVVQFTCTKIGSSVKQTGDGKKKRSYVEADGTLTVNGVKAKVSGRLTWRMGRVDKHAKFYMTFVTEITGADIGLKEHAKVKIRCEVGVSAQGG